MVFFLSVPCCQSLLLFRVLWIFCWNMHMSRLLKSTSEVYMFEKRRKFPWFVYEGLFWVFKKKSGFLRFWKAIRIWEVMEMFIFSFRLKAFFLFLWNFKMLFEVKSRRLKEFWRLQISFLLTKFKAFKAFDGLKAILWPSKLVIAWKLFHRLKTFSSPQNDFIA